MITIFERIKHSKKVYGTCKICKKRIVKTITAEQTVNPYNRHENGRIKTKQEVVLSVGNELANKIIEFKKNPICSSVSCRDEQRENLHI